MSLHHHPHCIGCGKAMRFRRISLGFDKGTYFVRFQEYRCHQFAQTRVLVTLKVTP